MLRLGLKTVLGLGLMAVLGRVRVDESVTERIDGIVRVRVRVRYDDILG